MTDKLTQAALDAAMKLMIDGLDMDPRGYPAHCEAIALAFDAFRPASQPAERDALRAKLAAAEAREGVQECLNVSAYRAGMKAGWNLCDAGDNEGYQRAMEGTDHIAELRRIRAALATEKNDE